jgi:hypothetical protein
MMADKLGRTVALLFTSQTYSDSWIDFDVVELVTLICGRFLTVLGDFPTNGNQKVFFKNE